MLLGLLEALRRAGLPVGPGEWLVLLDGLSKGLGTLDVDRFHAFARLCLVKDASHYDRYDRAFSDWFAGRVSRFDELSASLARSIPSEWLDTPPELAELSDEQRAAVEAAGGWDELMRQLAERLAEQDAPHHGGSRWIGSGGTSPFGHGGHHPQGVRIGGDAPGTSRAVKVWEQRRYRDLDGEAQLDTRNLRVALRQLRRLASEGRPDLLDLDDTVRCTAAAGGLLDVKLRAERRNTVKVLLLIDVGGSMDAHARTCERLFSAARSEFRTLSLFYFHNCPYERVWPSAARRHEAALDTQELIRRHGSDHRLIIVGDASMSPYELSVPGGSVEHWNEEPGLVWLQRLQNAYPHCVWLNPQQQEYWAYTASVQRVHQQMQGRMQPLVPDGVARAVDVLKQPMRPVTPAD